MRKDSENSSSAPATASDGSQSNPTRRHPLFGALKGLLCVVPETDLTQPADPVWERFDPK
jgi:hypothetical protein